MKKLLIIFLILLGIYSYKLSTTTKDVNSDTSANVLKNSSINKINTPVQNPSPNPSTNTTNNSSLNGFSPPASNTNANSNTNTNVANGPYPNSLILKQNDNSIYNIAINEPIELDFKSKQQVLNLRKQYAAMSSVIIPANYSPSDTVFGQIQDSKPWWGLIGMMFAGPGQHSIDGLSEESRAINNPLLLFIVDPNFWFVNLHLNGADIYPKPVSITFQPSQKTITVVYNISSYNVEMNNFLISNAHATFGNSNEYTLAGVNARDFGYNFAYAYSLQNISFKDSNNNLSTNVQQLQDFLHTGGSCGYPGGCNNHSPAQSFIDFTQLGLPAGIGIKLWKQMPSNKNAPADIYYLIVMK